MFGRTRLLLLAAFGAFAVICNGSSNATPNPSEAQFVQQPAIAALVIPNGVRIAEVTAADGSMAGSYDKRKGGLAVEAQRRAHIIALAGAATQDPVQKKMLFNRALDAIEWGLAHAGPDGSFPDARGGKPGHSYAVHSKAMFIEASAHSLLLIRDGGADAQTQARARAVLPALIKSANWLAGSDDLNRLLARVKMSNQRFFPALALAQIGELAGDQAFKDQAKAIVQQSIDASQRPDGSFAENEGFDSNYQMVTLELLGRYLALLEPSPWRDYVKARLQKGVDRMLKVVSTDGKIDTSRNTRTTACKAPVPGTGAKGRDIDIIPLRLYYLGYLLGTQSKIDPLAQKVQQQGQSFTHKESCEAHRKGGGGVRDMEAD